MFASSVQRLSRLPLPVLRGMGHMAAMIFRYVPTRTADYATLNLEIAQPLLVQQSDALHNSSSFRHLIRQAQRNEILSYFEFVHIWGSSNTANIHRIHHVNGAALFHDALQHRRGLILIVPHLGTWEVMNAWFSQYTAMTVMYKPIKQPQVDDFIRRARSRERAQLVPTDERGVKQIFRTLKTGGVTAILPDHSPERHSEHGSDLIPWFGVPLYSSQLVAKLAQRTGATALIAYAIRNADGGFNLSIEAVDPRLYEGGASGTRALFAQLEQLIMRYPQHYHWSYKRFKANPKTHQLYTLPHDDALQLVRGIQSDSTAI